jgi:hypothetical protein
MGDRSYMMRQEEAPYGNSGANKYMFRFVGLAYGVLVLVLLRQLYEIAGMLYVHLQSLPGGLTLAYLQSGTFWRNGGPIIDALFLLVVLSGLWVSYYLVMLQSGELDHKTYSASEMLWDLAVLIGFFFTASSLNNMPEKAAIAPDTSWFGLMLLTAALCLRLVRAMHFVPNARGLEEALRLQAWTEMLVRMAHGLTIVAACIWLGLRYNRIGLDVLRVPAIIVEAVLFYVAAALILLLYARKQNEVEWNWAYRMEAGRFVFGGIVALIILVCLLRFRDGLTRSVLEYRGYFSLSALVLIATANAMRTGPAIPNSLELGGGRPVELKKLPKELCGRIEEIAARIYEEDCVVAVIQWAENQPAGIFAAGDQLDGAQRVQVTTSASVLKRYAESLVAIDLDEGDLVLQIGSIGLDPDGFEEAEFEVDCREDVVAGLSPCLVIPIVAEENELAASGAFLVFLSDGGASFVYRTEVQEMLLASCQLMAQYIEKS